MKYFLALITAVCFIACDYGDKPANGAATAPEPLDSTKFTTIQWIDSVKDYGKINEGQKLDVISAFQSYGEYLSGKIDDNRRREIIRHACPGAPLAGASC